MNIRRNFFDNYLQIFDRNIPQKYSAEIFPHDIVGKYWAQIFDVGLMH